MRSRLRPLSWIKLVAFGLCFATRTVRANYVPFLPQSFFFSYDPSSEPVPIPVTQQCQLINIMWSRGAATGPNPVAPYFLQIYTSAFIVPFTIPAGSSLNFSWNVPFAPGTLYQICMFDINGNTGGCQATYTVIPGTTSCSNITFPTLLDVEGQVWNGPLSQYGWIDQCTDLAVTPKNGTPPYIFTIAPTLHPPFNITSNTATTINWTVSLSWASQFYISVIDSVGNAWANGPLHSGEGTTAACLAISSVGSSPSNKPFPATLTAAVLSAFGGLLLGGVITLAFFKWRSKRPEETEDYINMGKVVPGIGTDFGRVLSMGHSYRPVPTSPGTTGQTTLLGHDFQYHVEPFLLPSEEARSPTAQTQAESSTSRTNIATSSGPRSETESVSQPQHQVYVVHHDGGRAPVTVYTPDGTEVVELPPTYMEGTSRTPDGRPPQPPTQRRRHAGSTPSKAGSSQGVSSS